LFYRVSLLVAAVLVSMTMCSAAAAQDVSYDVASGTDFSSYRTYKWQRAEKARYPDDVTDKILTSSIDAQLAAKGLTRTDSDTADIYVIYQLAIIESAEWSSFSSDIAWQGGANSLAGFKGATTNSASLIRVGSMIIDLYDVKQKKRVWQANATKTLGKTSDPKKMEKNAMKAMAKIFSKYPPGK
jgi:hypothetical protein